MTMTNPEPDPDLIEIRANDGFILRQVSVPPYDIGAGMARMREAMEQMSAMMAGLPPLQMEPPPFLARRGGITYPKPDQRQGEQIEVRRLVPGDRVFILEGVFTVYRVDMKAPIPTVWLKELPDSPLYFEHTDYIPLAIETED
jgi:hypothetical protein